MEFTAPVFDSLVWVIWSFFLASTFLVTSLEIQSRVIIRHLRYLAISIFLFFPIFYYVYMMGEQPPYYKVDLIKVYLIFFCIPPNIIFLIRIIFEALRIYKDFLTKKLGWLLKKNGASKLISKIRNFKRLFKAALKEKNTLFYFLIFVVLSVTILITYLYQEEESEVGVSNKGYVKQFFEYMNEKKRPKEEDLEDQDEVEEGQEEDFETE